MKEHNKQVRGPVREADTYLLLVYSTGDEGGNGKGLFFKMPKGFSMSYHLLLHTHVGVGQVANAKGAFPCPM
jgi:hypothetical protein